MHFWFYTYSFYVILKIQTVKKKEKLVDVLKIYLFRIKKPTHIANKVMYLY